MTAESWNSRTLALLGPDGVKRLEGARVLVVGIGGVGGYAAEVLARSGVGALTLLDADCATPSNLNRQPIALRSTLGRSKVELMAARIADINPDCRVTQLHEYLTSESAPALIAQGFDYVADCIDTVAPKVALLRACVNTHTHVISSMGAGGRLDPSQVRYSRLWETREDGLARAVRNAFKKLGCRPCIPVVYSPETPHRTALLSVEAPGKRSSFGTLASIPAIFGIFVANHIIRSLTGQ